MSKSKNELCSMLVEVQQENKSLKLVNSFIKNTMRRLENKSLKLVNSFIKNTRRRLENKSLKLVNSFIKNTRRRLENKSLKLVNSFIKNTMRRLEYLERIQSLSQQYERRSSIEILVYLWTFLPSK